MFNIRMIAENCAAVNTQKRMNLFCQQLELHSRDNTLWTLRELIVEILVEITWTLLSRRLICHPVYLAIVVRPERFRDRIAERQGNLRVRPIVWHHHCLRQPRVGSQA